MACYVLKFDGISGDEIRIPSSVDTFNLNDFAKDLFRLVEQEKQVEITLKSEEEVKELSKQNTTFYTAFSKNSLWLKLAKLYGYKIYNLYPLDGTTFAQPNEQEIIDQEYDNLNIGGVDSKTESEIKRDLLLIYKSDSIFAIATIIQNKVIEQNLNLGSNLQLIINQGIKKKIPIYIFNLVTNKWNKYNYATNNFESYEFTPILTEHAAVLDNDAITETLFNNIIDPLFKLVTKQIKAEVKKEKPLFIPSLFITGNANTTAQAAQYIYGIDTLRHPNKYGMHFGNPFSHTNYSGVLKVVPTVKDAVIAFEKWLRGEEYQDIEPQRRKWILDQINSGILLQKPLVYYTDKIPDNSYGIQYYDYVEAPNHAHILLKLAIERSNPTVSKATLNSGGAHGSDLIWGRIGQEFGIFKLNHFYNGERSELNAPYGNVLISQEDYEEGRYKVAQAAKANFGYQYDTMKDDRLIRNWSQVKYSDAIFAIGMLIQQGEKLFPNQSNDTRLALHTAVAGGTGYAVEMAIQAGKPVYVFDLNKKLWFTKQPGKDWEKCEIPTLVENFAGIGTRQINQDGVNAIRDVYNKTFGIEPPINIYDDQIDMLESLDINIFNQSSNNIYPSKQDTIFRKGILTLYDLFQNSVHLTLNEAITNLSKNTKITPLIDLLKFLKTSHNSPVDIELKDQLFDHLHQEIDGSFNANIDTILISKNSSKPIGQVLAHEIIHSLILDKLNANPLIRRNLETIINKAKEVLKDSNLYGLTSVEEFISEIFTEGKLITALSKIEGINHNKAKGILTSIIDWFKNCIHLIFRDTPTLLDNALYEIETLINSNTEYYDTQEKYNNALQSIILELNKLNGKKESYDASSVSDHLQSVVKKYPYFFNINKNLDDFVVQLRDKWVIKTKYRGKYLFNNRTVTNSNIRKFLHKGIFNVVSNNVNTTRIINSNKNLSNFAIRPFKFNFSKYNPSWTTEIQFSNVQAAYEYFKFSFSAPINTQPVEILKWLTLNISQTSALDAVKISKFLVGFNKVEWDKISYNLLKDIMKASFELNPTSLQDLIATGTAPLTNNNAKGNIQDIILYGRPIFTLILTEIRNDYTSKLKAVDAINKYGFGIVNETINTLESDNNELSEPEKKSIKTILGDQKPRVLVASEATDPVFHALKIKELVNEELKKKQKDRKFHMMYIITKHDGLPLKELAELKIPKFIHFSITSLGGTKYEPGVMKMDDLLDRIQVLINNKTLNPGAITIRIDPIIPGVTRKEDVEHIIQRGRAMGINKFRFSVMDSYGYTSTGERSETEHDRYIIKRMEDIGYNWDLYYGRNPRTGAVNFNAKANEMNTIYLYMNEFAEKYKIRVDTCGEDPKLFELYTNIHRVGCINVESMNAAMGTNDIAHIAGHQRGGCSCFGLTSDACKYDDECFSSCLYCYAKHNSDAALKYYNKDGTLKRNRFTEVTEKDKLMYFASKPLEDPHHKLYEKSQYKFMDEEYSYDQFIKDILQFEKFMEAHTRETLDGRFEEYFFSTEDLPYLTDEEIITEIKENGECIFNDYFSIENEVIIHNHQKLDLLPLYLQRLNKVYNSLDRISDTIDKNPQILNTLFGHIYTRKEDQQELIDNFYNVFNTSLYENIDTLLNPIYKNLWDFSYADPFQLQFAFDELIPKVILNPTKDITEPNIQLKTISTTSSELVTKLRQYLDVATSMKAPDITIKEIDKLEALQLITNYMNNLGIKVHLYTTELMVEKGFPQETESVVYNHEIYVNKDVAKVSAPIHEFMHLVFAVMKQENFKTFSTLMQELRGIEDFESIFNQVLNSTFYNLLIESDQLEEAFVRYLSKLIDGEIATSTEFELFYNKNADILRKAIETTFNVPEVVDLLDFLKLPFANLIKNGSELFALKDNTTANSYSRKKYKVDISGRIMDYIQNNINKFITEGDCK